MNVGQPPRMKMANSNQSARALRVTETTLRSDCKGLRALMAIRAEMMTHANAIRLGRIPQIRASILIVAERRAMLPPGDEDELQRQS